MKVEYSQSRLEYEKIKSGIFRNKYRLIEDYMIAILSPSMPYLETSGHGIIYTSRPDGGIGILIKKDSVWDGPSGPAIDSPASMAPSLLHDVLYRLIRLELIPRRWWPDEVTTTTRAIADEIFYRMLLDAGFNKFRALMWFYALRIFGRWAV